jgi:hypothetical protein
MQNEFGREASEKEIKSFLITNNRRFVVGNLLWYEDRFPEYAEVINRKVAYSPHNPNPATIPADLYNLVGFIDGCSFPVARITTMNIVMHSYYHKYIACLYLI